DGRAGRGIDSPQEVVLKWRRDRIERTPGARGHYRQRHHYRRHLGHREQLLHEPHTFRPWRAHRFILDIIHEAAEPSSLRWSRRAKGRTGEGYRVGVAEADHDLRRRSKVVRPEHRPLTVRPRKLSMPLKFRMFYASRGGRYVPGSVPSECTFAGAFAQPARLSAGARRERAPTESGTRCVGREARQGGRHGEIT